MTLTAIDSLDRAILVINPSDSRCGVCGRGAAWDELSHHTVVEYLPTDDPGCGVTWTHVSTLYTDYEQAVRKCRPDLEWYDL